MKKILVSALAVAALVSCQKNEPEQFATAAGNVTIDPVITRATEVNFEDGDKIGLTIQRADQSLYADNLQMTFAEGVFASNLTWYAESSEESSLTAYYPYSSEGIPTSFSVAADQSGTGYGASDLIAATKSGVLPSVNAISMNFRHMLTNLVINVDNESGANISSVALQGSYPTATVDLAAFTAAADETSTKTDIVAQQVTANETYRAIVVPQTVAFTLVVKTSDNKTLTQDLLAVALKQHGQYSVDVRVLPGELKVTMSGEIENWTNEGSIGSDNDNSVPFEEFDGYFMYDGERYNTVTLSNGQIWMASALRYVPEGYTPSGDATEDSHIWYPYDTDGSDVTALTDDATIAARGYFYDSFLAFGGVEVTPENCGELEGAQGICPTGWHIPTRAEYFDLCGNSNSAATGESGIQYNTSALFYDTNYSAGRIGLFNDGGFNYVLSGVRMQSNFAATASYQKTVTKTSLCSVTEWLDMPALSYYMTSTVYKPLYLNAEDPSLLTNIQFFALMSTFTTAYKEGKLSLAYASTKTGQTIRCVKNN